MCAALCHQGHAWRRLVTSRTSINQLLILRLLVHPTIWSLLIVVFSNTVRHIGTVDTGSRLLTVATLLPGL